MDLNRVAAFVRVVQDGSFTAAGRALGVPKSSVSRSVSQLEQELGIRLLHRTTRKLRLTDAGTVFYERVARALTDIDDARSAASELQVEPRGTVRITAPPDFATAVLAPILARFAKKHPRIVVDLVLTGRLVDLVAEGFDLAVRAGPLRDSSLVVRRFGTVESAVYAAPQYLARRGAPRTVADLADHDAVLFRAVDGRATWTLRRSSGEERSVDVTGPLASDDLAFAHRATVAGVGLSLLPRFLCSRQEGSGRLVRVLPGWHAGDAVLHVVYPSVRFVPQRVVIFREFLVDALASFERECHGRAAEE